MKTTLKDFNTSVSDLKSKERNGEQLEQSHFGDFLMIEEEEDKERYRVWLNHPENVKQGEAVWQIEYCGESNRYTWKTIAQGND